MLLFCLQSATSVKHLAFPVFSLVSRKGGKGVSWAPCPQGGPLPWVGGDKSRMKESAPLDGSEGIAGAGGGQGQVADKKNDSSGLTPRVFHASPSPGLARGLEKV